VIFQLVLIVKANHFTVVGNKNFSHGFTSTFAIDSEQTSELYECG
jgi:small ligand-binding sensory domain FIST